MDDNPVAQMMAQMNRRRDEDTRSAKDIVRDLKAAHGQRTEGGEPFKLGDIVTHRYPAHASTKGAQNPVIVEEILAEPVRLRDHPEAFEEISDWSSSAAPHEFDFVVGSFMGGSYCLHFQDSRDYRHLTDAEREAFGLND